MGEWLLYILHMNGRPSKVYEYNAFCIAVLPYMCIYRGRFYVHALRRVRCAISASFLGLMRGRLPPFLCSNGVAVGRRKVDVFMWRDDGLLWAEGWVFPVCCSSPLYFGGSCFPRLGWALLLACRPLAV